MDLEALSRVRYYPVRHHSPRSTQTLLGFLEAHRPRAVLVEGPADASALIDVLVDDATEPPVAVLGYRTSDAPASSLWPFASYSPEYAALRWARREGCLARFIDVPVGQVLAGRKDPPGHPHDDPTPDPYSQLAREQGFRSFEELWEARFEAPEHGDDGFSRLARAFAGWSRQLQTRPFDRGRDAHMARSVLELVDDEGLAPEDVVVVMGAAHVAVFVEGQVALDALAELPAPVSTEVTLIPFSFPRLAEQLGYGAGNRAPLYYQRAHDAGCDYRRASLEVLLDVAAHLRLRGFAVSLADTIEAYRLALRLAELRDKPQPGLDEVREGAGATLFRGDTGLLDELLWPTVVGKRVGKVAARIGRNALEQEFWYEVRSRRLPEHDSAETFTLQLHNEIEVGTSIFLHRLRLADVPYATFLGSRDQSGSARGEEAGGIGALRRARELWEAQWTPATAVALAEGIALGDSLQQVATRRLEERLAGAASTGEAAEVLLESVVSACPRPASEALSACDRYAAEDDDVPSLAGACQALSGLVSFGTSRAGVGGEEAVERLCCKTFERGVLRLDEACVVQDEGLPPVVGALRALHEVATSQALVDRRAWFAAAKRVADSYAVHPALSGLATGLLYLAQAIDEAELSLLVEQRLSDVSHPERAARFLGGFLEVNALVLVRNRDLVRLLDAFLASLVGVTFRQELPVLRRAFARLGATERRYLLENVVALRALQGAESEVKAVLSADEAETLEALDAEVGEALDDLDELL